MEELLPWVQSFLTFLGPILVVVATARSERNRKSDTKVKELEAEKAEKEKQEQRENYDKLQRSISDVSTKLVSLDATIRDMQQIDKNTEEGLHALARHDSLNGRYVHQLALLVMTLAEGMRDQHLDGNITKAIAAYRRFEQDALSDVITKPAIKDDK